MRPGDQARRRSEAGFTYIGLLALIVLIGIVLAAAGQVASTTAQREREAELLFVGHQYREAIGRFVNLNRRYPPSLAQLVDDAQGAPTMVHYLRRLYADPITGSADWTLVPAPDGGVMGVTSASAKTPLKRDGFEPVDETFKDAGTYAGWAFLYDPVAARRLRLNRSAGTAPSI